jgi:hypothetical protein
MKTYGSFVTKAAVYTLKCTFAQKFLSNLCPLQIRLT